MLEQIDQAMARLAGRNACAALEKLFKLPRGLASTISDGMPESGGGGAGGTCASAEGNEGCDASGGAPSGAGGGDDDGGGGEDADPEPEPPRSSSHPSSALLRLQAVSGRCDLGRSRIYSLIEQGLFPPPVKIGRSSRWVASEVDAWIASRIRDRATTSAN